MFTSRNQNKLHCNFELVCNKNWRARMVLPGVSKGLILAVLHGLSATITCFFLKTSDSNQSNYNIRIFWFHKFLK